MPKKTQALYRRDFLRASGAGLAGLASASLWSNLVAEGELPGRSEPADPVVLRSPQLEVVLDRKDALPYEYRLLSANARVRGEDAGGKIGVTLCRLNPRGFTAAAVTPSSVKASGNQADFQCTAAYEGKPAASFVVRYSVEGTTVVISLEAVEEREGYELIEVAMPRLATVREEDGPAWLAHGDNGGSLAMLSEATPGHLPPNTFWGNVLATMPAVMIGTDRWICVQEVTAYMDGTELAVAGENGHRRASLGTVQTYRVNGSLCYDMNLTPPPGPRNCGNDKTPNLLIGQKSACRLDFIGDLDGNGTVDWLDGALLLRRRTLPIATHYYDGKLVYGIHCDEPKWEKPGATFEQAGKLIRDIATLTDHAPQIAHLWGWQYKGKDTGYPAVAEVNQRIGGYDGLMRLMEEGSKVNCNVTFSDNYDDAYQSSPAWDPAMIARRPDGELWKSRNWTAEDSYIVGLAKYMKGPGLERVRTTCERYKLRETTHIDVLTYYSIRNDWDPAHPASGIKNLEGRYKVLEEFAKRGVDVSSEFVRYAFIGKVSYFWNGPGLGSCPFGGKPIPLLAMIYRKSAIWGLSGRGAGAPDKMLHLLFSNGSGRIWINGSTDRRDITDWIYLMMVPWFKVHNRNIEWFRRVGDRTVIGLEGDATLDLDWKKKTYSVWIDGETVAQEGKTFCPLDESRLALYALTAGELWARLPRDWDPAKIAAIALDLDRPIEVPVAVEGWKVTASIPARRPVIVYRDGESAKKRLLRP